MGGGQRHWSYAIGVDLYNHVITGDKAMTLCGERADPHHMPCVILKHESD